LSLYSRARLFCRAQRYRLKLDPAEIAFARHHARPGTTAVDIGAHKGGYAYWLSRAVGPEGRLLAFEPQPELAGTLGRAFETRRNVTIENMGLSDFSGCLPLLVPGLRPSPGASFETTESTAGARRQLAVPVTTLDLYLAAPHPRVSLIKCDVEGHELRVFQGARSTLDRERPALLFECEKRHLAARDMGEVFGYLGARGYRGFFFAPRELRPLEEFDPARHQDCPKSESYCNNFAFLPTETL
jgi:FkbM family methyltransferase